MPSNTCRVQLRCIGGQALDTSQDHWVSRFHHPMHRRYWTDPRMTEHYDAVWELVAAARSAWAA
jgi:hypothetical protein